MDYNRYCFVIIIESVTDDDDDEIKTASPRPTPEGPLRYGRNVTNGLMILYNIILYYDTVIHCDVTVIAIAVSRGGG